VKSVLFDGQLRLADDYVETGAGGGEVRARMNPTAIGNRDVELVPDMRRSTEWWGTSSWASCAKAMTRP
jgi:hypothetical protein